MWPHNFEAAWNRGIAAAMVILCVCLLMAVAISSARLAAGTRLGRVAVGSHALWVAVFLYLYAVGWGPLAIRFSAPTGSIEGFVRFNKAYPLLFAMPALLLLIFYSAIPAFVNRFSDVLASSVVSRKKHLVRLIAGVGFASVLVVLIAARQPNWHLNELLVGAVGFAALAGSFIAAGIGAAMGDRVSARILLGGAATFGLVQVFRF